MVLLAFMRLCVYEGGLFFATSLRLVPPPVVGKAARFLSLETVKTATSPAMSHHRGNVNTAQEAARAHQLLLRGPFSLKGPFSNLSPTRDRRGLRVLLPPSGEVFYKFARYFWPENFLPFWI
jgi:hypothetical protein